MTYIRWKSWRGEVPGHQLREISEAGHKFISDAAREPKEELQNQVVFDTLVADLISESNELYYVTLGGVTIQLPVL